MAVVVAELERDLIRSRTREALAVRRDHGSSAVRGRRQTMWWPVFSGSARRARQPTPSPWNVALSLFRQQASVIRRQWNGEAVTLPRRGTAEPNILQIIGGFVATESLFFASSGPD
jgi:DNA invertase Pin-like site-specific DNA recombinase